VRGTIRTAAGTVRFAFRVAPEASRTVHFALREAADTSRTAAVADGMLPAGEGGGRREREAAAG